MSNLTWVLVRENTHEEVMVGDTITSFRGDTAVLKGGTATHTNRQARGVCSSKARRISPACLTWRGYRRKEV
jgi:hypothetical protein